MPNNLPLNWCECCIKDIANIQTGKLDANAAVENGIYPFFTCALEPLRINTFSFDENCIYLPGNGANVGYVGYYQGKFDAYQRTYVLDKIAINERYLYFSILLNWKNYNKDKQFGVATNFIRLGNLENYPINLPPLAEQGRIVEKIEEMFEKIDAGVEKLKSAQEKIKQYKQSVLHSAFTGKLEKVSNWKHAFLKEICNKITDGSHFSPESDNSYDYPYITVKDIFNDNIMFSSAKKIKKIDYEKLVYNGCKPNIGDVLFSKDGTVGKVSLIQSNINFVVLSSLAILTPNYDKITSKFLFYMLKSPEFLSEALKNKTGVAIRRIILATLKNIKVFYPSDISEQERIVEEIEKRFAKADKMLEVVEKSLKFAEQLKQSVLKKAFEGKLVPQDPNDEPASVLLARIKSEKQQNEKAKGKRNDRK